MAKYDVNLRDYWRIIRRRKNVIIITAITISFITFFFAKFNAPAPQYEATSAIKFERSTNVTGLFVEAISYSTGDPLATQATMITSGPVMEKVAKEIGLIDSKLSSNEIRRSKELSRTIANLENQIKSDLLSDTYIINITATASTPKMAQRLANTVARVYREKNIAEKNKRIREVRAFIEEQLVVVGNRLRDAEEKLKAYKKEKRLVELPYKGLTSTIAPLADLESEHQKIKRKTEEATLQLDNLRMGIEPSKVRVFLEGVSPTITKLNTALLDLIVRRDTLLLNYTKKSPEIRQAESQIRSMKETVRRALSSSIITLGEKQQVLNKQLRNMYKDIPEKLLELVRLQREVKVNEGLYSLLKSRYQEALIKEAEQVEEVVIVKHALEPTGPIEPARILGVSLAGILIGCILGLLAAITFESLDTSIGTIEDVEQLLTVPVLGIIPYSRISEVKEALADKFPDVTDENTLRRYAYLFTHFAPNTPLAESYQTLRTNIQFMEKKVKTLLITSSSPSEGKTATVINLALSMAQTGKKVLLVESDVRKPKISRNFGIGRDQPGLVDILLGNYRWTDVTKTITDIMLGKMTMKEIMRTPGMDNIDIIPCGMRHPNPAEIIGSSKMKDFVNETKQKYDIVLFDSPPVLTASDSAIIAAYTDGVLMVYQVGEVARGALKRTKAQLDAVKAKIIGVVLNGVKPEISTDYDTLKYGYYYYGGKGRKRRDLTRKKSQNRVASLSILLPLLIISIGIGGWNFRKEISALISDAHEVVLVNEKVPSEPVIVTRPIKLVKSVGLSDHRKFTISTKLIIPSEPTVPTKHTKFVKPKHKTDKPVP